MRIFSLFTVFYLLIQQFCCCNSIDTITFDSPLKDDHRNPLVYTAGTFVLGFFSPGKSTNRYIGIWYNFSNETVVWVANRDNPVRDSSGVLALDQTGNLVITASNLSAPVWSTTNVSASRNRVFAQLMDTGNLRLLHDNTVVWQSIDHPTDTILPSMKLGLDRRTNRYTVITSWKSPDDPGTGEYTYRMDLTELPELVYEQGPRRLWRTGPWIGNGWSGIPELLINDFIFSVVYTNDRNEVTLAYSNSSASIIPRLVANETGNLQRLAWQEGNRQWYESWSYQKEECNNYNHCGAYGNCDPQPTRSFECTCLPGFEPKSTIDWFTIKDGSGGCVRKQGRTICREGDGFVPVVNAKLSDMRVARVNMTIGLEACKENCLKNCNCSAYSSARGVEGEGSGCITWIGELLDTRVFPTGGQTLYVRVDNVELAEYLESQRRPRRSPRRKRMTYIIVAATTVPLALIGALIVYWFMTQKRRKDRKRNNRHMLFTTANGSSSPESSTRETPLDDFPFFDLSTIVASTDNFSISNKLGEGGFGMVYKGRLRNGVEIAVKRLAKNSGQGTEEFKNEVCLIAKLQHRNLVRLLGSCVEHREKMLIYEYLPNKSLDSFIFDEEKRSQLNWEKRFNIILGIARGVIYLHQDSRLRIIHRDLKASNVLLDDELSPKISDFGMAKIFKGDQMEANTKRVVGTYGYMSPEYAMGGLYSTRSDVFSFGVILIEVITGKKNSTYYRDDTINLIGHTWNLWKEDKALEIIDRSMGDSWPEEEVLRCVHIGLLCVQELVMDRPTMSDVAFMLCNEIALPFPKQPAFISNGHDMNDSSTSDVKAKSYNGITITQIEAR